MIYVIKSHSYVKIGYAKDPCKRVRALQCANPEPLELIAIRKGGFNEEAGLHREFADYHHRGEWFTLNDAILEFFKHDLLKEPILGTSTEVSSSRYTIRNGKTRVTDEDRERRRQNVLKQKALGKMGPEFGALGGRPRKTSVSK